MTQQENAWQYISRENRVNGPRDHLEERHDNTQTPHARNRRARRTPVAIHSGLGFDANAVRNRSRQVALQANEQRESRLRELMSEPIAQPVAPSVSPPLSTPMPMSMPTPMSMAVASQKSVPLTKPPLTKPPLTRAPVSFPVATKVSERPKISQPAKSNEPLQTGRAFLGWILDGTVALSALILSILINLASLPNHNITLSNSMLKKFGEMVHIGNPFTLIVVLRMGALAIGILFAAQFVMFMLTRASAGRFAVGAALPRSSFGGRIFDALFGALSEVVTLGGALAFPLLLLMPARIPLAPWLRMETQKVSHPR